MGVVVSVSFDRFRTAVSLPWNDCNDTLLDRDPNDRAQHNNALPGVTMADSDKVDQRLVPTPSSIPPRHSKNQGI